MKTNKSCPGSTVVALLFVLLCMSLGAGSEALAATGNETCSTATDLGNLTQGTLMLPSSQNASLNSTQTPDVDYFRISGATPGSLLSVTLTGVDPGNGIALLYPAIGVFDSGCRLQKQTWFGYQTVQTMVTVPPDGTVILAAAGWPDTAFTGGGSGGYRIEIKASQTIGSISGTVLDGSSNAALPWNAYPSVELDLCLDTTCSSTTPVRSPWVDQFTGKFLVDNMSLSLEAGTYRVVVNATGYQTLTRVFYAAAGTNVDLGVLGLAPLPYIGSISGTFVDRDSLQPIQGGGVLFQCLSSDCANKKDVAWIRVDAAGHFSVSQNWYGQPLPAGTYQVLFSDNNIYLQRYDNYWSAPMVVGAGENLDMGKVALAHFPYINSLSGRAVDALTLAALPGTADPFAKILITNCNKLNQCTSISTDADSQGRFTVSYDARRPLFAGPTTVTIFATQYQTYTAPQVLDLLPGENRDLGDLKVPSNPIRFTNIKPCTDIPSAGGKCQFSVTLVNGQAKEVNATVWSEISAGGLGSFVELSNFTLGKQTISFGPGTRGASVTVNFVLDVPAAVADYASFAAAAYIGEGPNPWLQPIGSGYLFGMRKVPNAPSLVPVTEKEAKELMKKSVEKLDPEPDERIGEQDRPPVLQGPIPWTNQ